MRRKNSKRMEFLVLIEQDEDGMLVASAPALKGCHTQAKDMGTLMKRIKEAIALCVESQKEAVSRLRFVGIQEIAV